MNIFVDTQPHIQVNVAYNACDIALHTVLNRAGTAVVVLDELFGTKRNLSVPDRLSVKMLSIKF